MKVYHVTKNWDGGDLESLYDQHGDEAYDIFAEKWPEAGGMAASHIHLIHLHDNINDAKRFQAEFGGEILEIEIDSDNVEIDTIEYPHPTTRYSIDAQDIKRI